MHFRQIIVKLLQCLASLPSAADPRIEGTYIRIVSDLQELNAYLR
jgi:hypothetical protein